MRWKWRQREKRGRGIQRDEREIERKIERARVILLGEIELDVVRIVSNPVRCVETETCW